jgi:hypothetical protein
LKQNDKQFQFKPRKFFLSAKVTRVKVNIGFSDLVVCVHDKGAVGSDGLRGGA